jgi:hypothetical protein
VLIRNADPAQVQWNVDAGPTTATGPEFLYKLSGSGPLQTVKVNARIPGSPPVADWATVTLLNYDWPGII